MINIVQVYSDLCNKYNIPFNIYNSVLSYDDSSLFCPAGMQQYKPLFTDTSYVGTIANIQKCIRLNDFESIDDGVHALSFDMIGLFSFREWTIQQAVNFFLDYLSILGIVPNHVTIPPQRPNWADLYPSNIPVRISDDCRWEDGNIGGFCTEFFINDSNGEEVEIGNIVNPIETCIDVGFGIVTL